MFINQNKLTNHNFFMQLALNQARASLGNTNKNPAVGCVITKNQTLISAARTSITGRPHAEKNAINLIKGKFHDSDLYVTLEPCSHYGKTPPCTNLITKKRFKRVFFSALDLDPRTYNKSLKKIKKKGIKVQIGLCKSEINNFYESYFKSKNKELPYVTCKLATSRDFYTTNKRNKWITNKYSRGRVHLMRSEHDCIITSSNTIIEDNPLLNCRIRGLEYTSPSVVILDKKLKTPLNSKIIKNIKSNKLIIFYNNENKKKLNLLLKLRVKLYKIPLDEKGDFDLKKVLIKIKKLGFSRIFLEAGVKLSTSFLIKNLVNNFCLFRSKRNLSSNGGGILSSKLKSFLKTKKSYIERVNLFDDKLIIYKIK